MRRRPTLAALAALCSIVFVAGCGGDDDGAEDTSSTTTEASETTTTTTTTTAPEAEDAAVDCDAYDTVVGLFSSLDEIATGNDEAQVAADETLATAIATLASSAEGDVDIAAAVDTLGQVSFQVAEEATGPTADEVDAALVTIQDAWSSQCPAPIETEADGATEQPECPAPEVLEAEGFACDSEGHLTPLDEETVGECPAPEVLEAEGFTCDAEGNLTPIEE